MTEPAKVAPWSYSRLKAFETCPKQFYHTHILKEFPYKETEAMRYGTEFHTAAEEFIRDGKPVPERFAFAKPALQVLNDMEGDKYCELKLGLTADLEPCGFFAEDVWFRGVVDLIIVNDKTESATVIDYKTGKSSRYADKGQLELMALAVFKHFPQVKRVRAGLLFVIAEDFVKGKYGRDDESFMWQVWLSKFSKMEKAAETDVWNPRPSGLCRAHCPVTQCPHNGAN
jgi:CRISPR/Cas system-associated exonuclease Cas4 (RecB family)